ncbi:hypothetical protein P280DRAFT_500016 [Massarina eburnea CBS 473.64]|uniref:DUF8021 domain-containing protein n=1 Tax=Massarina eburnea CBS 473.64 TaxID=1395130 RepID=A0A6A6RUZ5_9PLEO|nr:hypothetical protein P280DRAFT_500016 [Massarina eburnea CBS 473.64]
MLQYLATVLTLVAATTAHCELHHLSEAVESYLDAQKTGQIAAFAARFDNASWIGYYENAKKVPVETSILTKPLAISHTRSIHDLTICSTFTEVVVNSTTDLYVIGTQLRFANHQINKVDSLITKPGDWLFNVTGTAYWTAKENWDPIPVEKQDSRDTIRKAADAYCDLFNNPNTTVPWGTPCVRLEGGLYGNPGPNGSCAVGVPTGTPLTNRRYVIDESMGSVDVLLDFGKSKWPDSHQFRIEGGKIRDLELLQPGMTEGSEEYARSSTIECLQSEWEHFKNGLYVPVPVQSSPLTVLRHYIWN